MKKVFKNHSILITYILIFVLMVGGFSQAAGQRHKLSDQNRKLELANKNINRQAALVKEQSVITIKLFCNRDKNSWDQRKATILTLTQLSKLDPSLVGVSGSDILRKQIAHSNKIKLQNRKYLLSVGGKRPKC